MSLADRALSLFEQLEASYANTWPDKGVNELWDQLHDTLIALSVKTQKARAKKLETQSVQLEDEFKELRDRAFFESLQPTKERVR